MGSNNSSSKKSRRSSYSDSTKISNRLNNFLNSSLYRDKDNLKSFEHKSLRRREATEYFNSLKNIEVYCIEKSNLKSKLSNPMKLMRLNDSLINQICQNYFDKELNSGLLRATISKNYKGNNFTDILSNDDNKSQLKENKLQKNINSESEILKEMNSLFSECETFINTDDNCVFELSKENSNYSTNYTTYESLRSNLNVTRKNNKIKIDLRSLVKDSNSQSKRNKFFRSDNKPLITPNTINTNNPSTEDLKETLIKFEKINLNPKKLYKV